MKEVTQYEQGQIVVEQCIIYKEMDKSPDLSAKVHPSHHWSPFRASVA